MDVISNMMSDGHRKSRPIPKDAQCLQTSEFLKLELQNFHTSLRYGDKCLDQLDLRVYC